jgi:hypothetical protein
MSKLPPRRILRGIVCDAIEDRNTFEDPNIEDQTNKYLSDYKNLLKCLGDVSPPLSKENKIVLRSACRHARYWRESFKDAYQHTGDKQVLLEAQRDLDWLSKTEAALGVQYRELKGDLVSIFDLKNRVDINNNQNL